MRRINQAAVLGAGVMGAGIAAHLANAGIPTYLLDIVPPELTEEEQKKGLTRESPAFRNRFAQKAKEQLLKASPAPLYLPENAELITPGNLEDHLALLSQADWIIEVVVERLDIKQNLLQKVEQVKKPGSIVSSNTSGISINKMSQGLSAEFRQHFLGTHFFNPPRYMPLLEIIPGKDTLPEIVQFMLDFGSRVLGKGVVLCKDTPNFIANRIGVYGMLATIRAMVDMGLTVEEVDALTGPALGRPKSASFRTLDMVGLDILLHVAKNVYDAVEDPAEKQAFAPPPFLEKMAASRWLGDKTGQGFYKKVKTPKGKEILALDCQTLEYRPRQKARIPSLEAAKQLPGPAQRIKALLAGKDKGARFVWRVTKETLLYTAAKAAEIAGDIKAVDQAMKWGFNWELGPFELWDAIGVAESVARMKAEGDTIPPLVENLLASGKKSFYQKKDGIRYYYDLAGGDYKEEALPPGVILLPALKEKNRLIKANQGASLIDLGDGVACLEFHSKSNAIGADIIDMVRFAVREVEENYEGLVIGNHGKNFSVGANLMLILFEAEDENWDELDLMVQEFQNATMSLKYCKKPVVAAPFRMALGGGCEFCLHSDLVQACAETYMGLVEVGVGLLPAGGGTKEMLFRAMEQLPSPGASRVALNYSPVPLVCRAFETIATAKVSTSGPEAVKIGYLRPADRITLNPDRLLHDAKQAVLELAQKGYRPPRPAVTEATGSDGYAAMQLMIYTLREGNYISDYDAHVARKVAHVLAGGSVTPGTRVSEQYILDLEREAFLSLLGEPKTQERMRYMLAHGRPLRN
ncbi:MAG: 3-hydroxyacyl-CoA dehydrogenase [Peptococcaceae bacterium]|nr:3-hydroxyacyl-CoA dehydrogenase [Peptococcaceae bacterium]